MGTNFYFRVKGADKIAEQFKGLSSLITDDMIDGLKYRLVNIHIGKTSCGWKPLFESQSYFKSMDELEAFYQQHKETIIVEDEYETEYTWEGLKERLFNWNPTGKSCVKDANKEEYNYHDSYYVDNTGYEWTKSEFS
ncbi:MAG TPA: hypothetical protein VIK72_13425 [Clostridiaceae bacterium]